MTKEEYLEQKRYFVLYLKNGEVFDFDKETIVQVLNADVDFMKSIGIIEED